MIDRDRLAAGHAPHDLFLLIARGVADAQLEHEAVDLRLRERVRSLLLDRILCREDKKRFLELVSHTADRDLLFLHRLEQRRLDLCRRAIDLVGENDVREDWTFLDEKLSCRLIIDLRTDNVSREQVGCKLNPAERRADGFGERAHGERFRETRHTLEEYVTSGEEADQQPVDHIVLTDDATRDLTRHVLNEAGISRR